MLFLYNESSPRNTPLPYFFEMKSNQRKKNCFKDKRYLQNKSSHYREGFNQGYINPYHLEEYNSSGPDVEYYYDRSGLKGSLFKILPSLQIPDRIIKPSIKKEDHFNCVMNKLELYNDDIYNDCSLVT